MKYGVLFLIIASLTAVLAVTAEGWLARVALGFVTLTSLAVSIAYLANAPSLLLKRPDGSRPWWAWIVLGPYFGLSWLVLWLYAKTHRGDPSTEVASGVWLGRRPWRSECDACRWVAVVDLTAEFPRAAVTDVAYLLLPTLDTSPPSVEQLEQAVRWIEDHRARGPVLVHCALGHGRSASVVLAWWIATGQARTIAEAIERLRTLRPGIGLKPAQLARLQEFASSRSRVSGK